MLFFLYPFINSFSLESPFGTDLETGKVPGLSMLIDSYLFHLKVVRELSYSEYWPIIHNQISLLIYKILVISVKNVIYLLSLKRDFSFFNLNCYTLIRFDTHFKIYGEKSQSQAGKRLFLSIYP